MRKPAFCICKNKDADQLHSNCPADQRLCFRYMDSTIPLLSKSKISSLYPSSVAVQPGLCWTLVETAKTGLLTTRLKCFMLLNMKIRLHQKTGLRLVISQHARQWYNGCEPPQPHRLAKFTVSTCVIWQKTKKQRITDQKSDIGPAHIIADMLITTTKC